MPQKSLKQFLHDAGPMSLARSAYRRLAEFSPAALRQRRRMLDFYGQFVKPGDLCFDIGANIGNRTDVFLKLGARVAAVDPQPLCLWHLRRRFGRQPRVSLVPKALGAAEGVTRMFVGDADMISSLSAEWIEKVRASGRFGGHQWNKQIEVQVTTLDALIREFGRPAFCKIDVEGYEDQVLSGLSRPLDMISFEFTPEALAPALACIRRLAQLGPTVFNYSLGESMQWQSSEWLRAEDMAARLQALPDPSVFGDVYARAENPASAPRNHQKDDSGAWGRESPTRIGREAGAVSDSARETCGFLGASAGREKSMKLVTIYPGHNATVAYFENGEVRRVLHEEKFSNLKNHTGFPHRALAALAQEFDFSQVDGFSFPFTDILWMCVQLDEEVQTGADEKPTYRVGNVVEDMSRSRLRAVYDWIEYKLPFKFFFHLRNWIVRNIIGPGARKELNAYLRRTYNVGEDKIRYFDHHGSHIASTLYFYNLRDLGKDVLLFSLDGAGDGNFATVCVYRAATGRIERIARSDFDASLGLLFSGLTKFLGMKPNEHEYKVMGLAAYVNEKKYYQKAYDRFAELIRLDEKKLVFTSKFNMNLTLTSDYYFREHLVGERFDNVSAGLQVFLEDIVCRWIKAAVAKTGIDVVGCSGGVFMNVKLNQRIQNIPEVKQAYFMPSCGDESTVLGCAPVICWEQGIATHSTATLYQGQTYTNAQVEKFLREKGYFEKHEVVKIDDLERKTAELLKDFNIVARFKGACEWGARSLCHRAILGNASDLKTFYEVNDMIKMRDFWMPFAPTLLADWAGRYVKDWETLRSKVEASSGYMITAFDSTPLAQQHLRAAIHQKDKTLRPQIVREKDNPDLHRLLKEYERLTGMGGIMNTSLNIHGYPLVGTLEQAAFTFENSGLIYLTLENYLIRKR